MLQAHEAFARLSAEERAELLPGDYYLDSPGGKADCWPAAAVAACIVATGLTTLDSEADLRDAIAHFDALASIGVVDETEWQQNIAGVVGELMEWGGGIDATLTAIAETN